MPLNRIKRIINNNQNFFKAERCTRCCQILRSISVHGHTQCALCGQLVQECCQGSQQITTTEEKDDE